MKTFGTLFLVFILFSCGTYHRDTISGNGKVIQKQIVLDSFTVIDVSDNVDVEILISKDPKAIVEADENIVEHISVDLQGNTLNISCNKRIRIARSKKVVVYCPELKEIHASSAANVFTGKPVKTDELRIGAESAAKLNISGDFSNMDVNGSSSSDITLNGTTKSLSANMSSAADLNAFELLSEKAVVEVSSASDARINVSKEAHLRASSAGDIVYKGSPSIIESNSSSGADIKKSGD
jgi:hypothetical protein